MKTKAVFVLASFLAQISIAAAGALKHPNATAELKALQGAWNLVETDTQGQSVKPTLATQWIFAGQKLYLRTGNRSILQGVIVLNPTLKPKALDVVGKGMPPVLGIYELNGHTLKVSAAPNERPASFTSEGGFVVSVLERAKPPQGRHHGRALLSQAHVVHVKAYSTTSIR
jgi:uncharacterized protein (TIGR03067 family)